MPPTPNSQPRVNVTKNASDGFECVYAIETTSDTTVTSTTMPIIGIQRRRENSFTASQVAPRSSSGQMM